MAERLSQAIMSWRQPQSADFTPYLRSPEERNFHPEIDPDQLCLELVWGEGRDQLKLLTAGEASLLLRYRKRNGYISSVQEAGEDLEILQFQGAKQEGYRLVQGVNVAKLMADYLKSLAINSDVPFQRIIMAHPIELTGNMSSIASHNAVLRIPETVSRYNTLISYLGMQYSETEQKFIREIDPHF